MRSNEDLIEEAKELSANLTIDSEYNINNIMRAGVLLNLMSERMEELVWMRKSLES